MVLTQLSQIYHNNLLSKHGRLALTYLNSRGLTKETLKHFQVGYCSHKVGLALLNQYTEQQLVDSEMFYQHKLSDGLLEKFEKIITIPIFIGKNVVNFTGRYVGNSWIVQGVHSPHKHRGGTLDYAFNENELSKGNYVVIVESPIDCMTLHQNEFHSIATFGINGISENTALKFKNKKVYISYDTDKNQSGQKGSERLAQMLSRLHIKSYIVTLPLGKQEKTDINSFFDTYTKDDYLDLIEHAHEYIPKSNKKQYLVQSSDMDIEKIVKRYIKTIVPTPRGFLIACPFHKDTKPSMQIYTDKNEFYCFGCGRAGSAIQLLVQLEKEYCGKDIRYKEAREIYSTF